MKNNEQRLLPVTEEAELEAFVEAFEAALEMLDSADWRAFVPAPDHRLFQDVATEIIRTDLEYRWSNDERVRVADYRSALPELFESTPHLADVAFEEYRQRRLAGEAVDRSEYAAEYGVDTTTWSTDDTITQRPTASQFCGDEESAVIGHTLDALDHFADIPDPGSQFGEFELVDLLGEGAFARVFLARQTALANRPVALKVAADRTFEADRLARLQHTNIVPVFSTHGAGGLHAVCMPYLGSVTLHDVLTILDQWSCERTSGKDILAAILDASHADEREQVASSYGHLASRSYVDAVIWILSRVVEGLARAHQLSIIHGDLKPANILLAHDGEPRLLDFNLSSEAAINAPTLAIVGGTLPYMSPCYLRSIRAGGVVTPADDIFSIGVIACEMLTLQRPFPQRTGEFDQIVADMIDDRQFITSTQLPQSGERIPSSILNDVEGALPVIVYGDIKDSADVDFFKIQVSGDYTGPLRFQVFTSGYSSLAARLTVFSETFAFVAEAAATSPLSGDAPLVQFNVAPDETYFVRVEGNADGVFGSGGYSLASVFEDINALPAAEIETFADGRYARLHPETLERLLSSDDDFVDEDEQENEDIDQAVELTGDVSFPNGTRYLVHGSISNEVDKDVYKIKTPEAIAQPVMTIAVQSLEAGNLVPRIAVYDGDEAELAASVISNGGGITIVQVAATESDAEYFVEVSAADNRLFRTGNYRLTVDFGRDEVQLEEVAVGSLDAQFNRSEHALYVAKPQVFHFVAEVLRVETEVPSAVRLEITDSDDHLLTTITTLPGETRSSASVLLLPGTYRVSFQAVTANGETPTAVVSYALRGTVVSDPLAIELDDPIDAPFQCPPPNGDGAFCYPDGTTTNNPFSWDQFVEQLFSSQSLPGAELVSSLNADWWSWYWAAGDSGAAPIPTGDTYQLTSDSILNATGSDGVLGNDVDPEGNPLLAVLEKPPDNGTLFFAADGTFTYLPDEGFQGTDQFAYRAFDLGSTSDLVTVFLEVFASGDFNLNGHFDASDIDTLSNAIRNNDQSDRYDLNDDLAVDMDDHAHLITATIGTFPGDANLDFQVDASDFDAWRAHAFSAATGWETGDFNADGVTDGSDFNLWNTYRFGSIPAATPTTPRTPRAPLATRVTAIAPGSIQIRLQNRADNAARLSQYRPVIDLIMAGDSGLDRSMMTSRHTYDESVFRLHVTSIPSEHNVSASRDQAQVTDCNLACPLPNAVIDVFHGRLSSRVTNRPATAHDGRR